MSSDLFADLLSSATGNKPKKNPNLQNLSLSERLNSPSSGSLNNSNGGSINGGGSTGNWTDGLDLLSQLSSPNPSTPTNHTASTSNNNINPNFSNLNGSTFQNPNSNSVPANKPDDFDKLFDIFNQPTPSSKAPSPPKQESYTPLTTSNNNNNNNSEFSLLDGEFTDAFTRRPTPTATEQTSSSQHVSPEMSRQPSQSSSVSKFSKRDHAVAELVDMGFPIEKANEALDNTETGDDINEAISYLMNAAHAKTSSKKPSSRHEDRYSPQGGNSGENDFSHVINDLSSQFMSGASFLLKTGKKKLAEGVESYRNQRLEKNDNLPIWMKNQQNYKSKSTLTPEDEEYEEMDYETMKSIVEEQRMRQKRLREEKRRDQSSRYQESQTPQRSSTPQSSKFDEIPTRRRNEQRTSASSSPVPSNPAASLSSNNSFSSIPQQPQRSSQSTPVSQDPAPTRLLSPDEALQEMFNAPSSNSSSSLPSVSRLDKLRNSKVDDAPMYVPASRRRTATPQSKSSSLKVPTVEISPQQTTSFNDYRAKAGEFFKKGDFSEALLYYQKASSALPAGHLLTIIAYSNLCVTYIKLGNSKDALEVSNKGLELIERICGNNYNELASVDIEESKSIKSFWFKLLSKKAEACEHLERYTEALEAYDLVVEYGGSSKPVMDGRRRCMDVLKPKPKTVSKPASTPRPSSTARTTQSSRNNNGGSSSYEAVDRIKAQNAKEESFKNEKFQLHDQVQDKIEKWSTGNKDNLRGLLSRLHLILWQEANWKQVPLTDLVLDKKVKIFYMKAIAKTHPDKIGNVDTEKKLIAQGIFVALNQAWDIFKEANNMS